MTNRSPGRDGRIRPRAAADGFAGAARALAVALLGALAVAPTAAAGQDEAAALRTPDGQPDLQGVWNFSTQTPMERPPELADRATLTPEEAAEWNRGIVALLESMQAERDTAPEFARLTYNQSIWFEWDDALDGGRTSLVIDPPNGRIPALRPAGRARAATIARRLARHPHDPEDRGPVDRCILGANSGPPMMPLRYNNNVQIFQSADYVVILNEMVHAARIVPLDGRPHLPVGLPQWMGDSRGAWDGDTLVVTTRNLLGRTSLPGSSAGMQLVERFTRAGPDRLIYEFTVRDPATWAGPWTAQVRMSRIDEPLFEYACHEGNYALANLLRIRIAADAEAAEAAAAGEEAAGGGGGR